MFRSCVQVEFLGTVDRGRWDLRVMFDTRAQRLECCA